MCTCAGVNVCLPACMWKHLLLISPLMRIIRYVSFICEEDYSVLAYNPFSGLNTPPSSSSNLQPVVKARTLNLWVSLCLWELTNNPTPPQNNSTAPTRLQWRWGALFYSMICLVCLRPNPVFTACLYIPAANGLHTETGSRPKSAGSSVQLGKGGTLSSARSTGD